DLLDELEEGATPTEEEAAKIRDAIAALGGVPGTEHLQHQEHQEHQEAGQEEPAEEHVNGWDESLVGDNAG
ncbi:MAG: hypothetical protein QOC63_2262, partial [Mycobacterium sp.]|nr:hypothetical protein [Mycobacterium sp.]